MTKLDYTLESPEERKALVEKILEETPDVTPAYLETLADYLVLCMEKQERKERKILTDNRLATVNKRECSFEGLASQMENGEDGIYNLISEDKHTIFRPKVCTTQEDLDTIPPLKQLREAIDAWEEALKRASGRDRYVIKKALIEMRKDQYIIKQAYKRPMIPQKLTRSSQSHIPLDDESYLEGSTIRIKGISLMEPKVCSAILCNYSKLKEDSYGDFEGDVWYLMETFDDTCDRALKDFPIYLRIVEMKIDKMQNTEIRAALEKEFGAEYAYAEEYISKLWRNKIPKVIAEQATEDFLTWWYPRLGFPMKKCSRCGQIKPAHSQFFSKNKGSPDNWYSMCKKCRRVPKGDDKT